MIATAKCNLIEIRIDKRYHVTVFLVRPHGLGVGLVGLAAFSALSYGMKMIPFQRGHLIRLMLLCITCYFGALATPAAALTPVPSNLFSSGDSMGEGIAADGVIGSTRHDMVWSTGYNRSDIVYSLNERFEDRDPDGFYQNNAERDAIFNHAVSGAKMDDFKGQADEIVAAAGATPSGKAGMITLLMGNNDVCADSLADMTPPEQFERFYRDGLDVLASSEATKSAHIHVSSIPAIYWLWYVKRTDNWCRVVAWPFVPCQNLLSEPEDDCGSGSSSQDPDTIHEDDGPNCRRRKEFHAKIRDIYNPILKNVLQEYINDGRLPNAYFVDIFDIRFEALHVNDGDCFHPSVEGQKALAENHWCDSPWRLGDPSCGPPPATPWIPLLLLDGASP
ncbi:MAG: SGNH/GDSL hydrolase family protein [Desulfobacterales bacterium]